VCYNLYDFGITIIVIGLPRVSLFTYKKKGVAMKCFTFDECLLKKGIEVSKIAPKNSAKFKGNDEALSIGKFTPGTGREYNLAKYIHFSRSCPVKIEEMSNSERIIQSAVDSSDGPTFDQSRARVFTNGFPKRESADMPNGFRKNFPVIYGEEAETKESRGRFAILRIRTHSFEIETERNGSWMTIKGWPDVVARARGTDLGCTWCDDLVTMGPGDLIKIIPMGSSPEDEHFVGCFYGELGMLPAPMFIWSGGLKKNYADDVESIMIEALGEFAPEEIAS